MLPQIDSALLFSLILISALTCRQHVSNVFRNRKAEITLHRAAIPGQAAILIFLGAIKLGTYHRKRTNENMNAFEVIKTVRLTEKGTRQGEKYNQYTVVADRRANKTEIRQAVQELFKVKVTKVNTLNVRGKSRRQRTTQAGKAPDWKKAIVTLKAGDKIVLT